MRRAMIQDGAIPLLARLLLASEFLIAVNGKVFDWTGQASYMSAHGMHFVTPLLAVALVVELVGSICLVTGFQARIAAGVMAVYLMIVSLELHDFWNQSGMAAGLNQTHFFKNLGMVGGLLMIVAYGPGRWALVRAGRLPRGESA